MRTPIRRLGVDTGGTFTDFVLLEDGVLRTHKILSTPDAPERAILQGVAELGVDRDGLRVIHGSTVATNAVLEGKGVRTAFVTNRGFADLLTLGRQARTALYDLQPAPLAPPVPAELCLETGGRLGADGRVVEDLTPEDLADLRARLAALAPRSVAVCLLFSFLDDRFERAIEAVVPPGTFVSRSSAVLPEYREYERGVATLLNAWVGPLVEGYLTRLGADLAPGRVAVMQSSGETVEAAQAGGKAVSLLLSGPAGGLAGARYIGECAGHPRLLTFDMGGTSTDVSLVDGPPRLTSEGRVGRYPVGVPMADIHTIGAGGGSIARVDAGGLLRVGPQSAGADPGPACYGRGGTEATVTDANLVLGRLRPDALLDGRMALDVDAAGDAVARVARAAGLTLEETADGIVRVANEHMAGALRVISVQRGTDPRGLTLLCFGGAGGLHVCALAESLDMREAIVPVHAGVLSALGMLVAPPGRQLSRTLGAPLEGVPVSRLRGDTERLEREGRESLVQEGIDPGAVQVEHGVDLRYRGQSFTLALPWLGGAATAEAFHAAHEARYGHRMTLPVEIVNVRVSVRADPLPLALAAWPARRGRGPRGFAPLRGVPAPAPIWSRTDLAAGQSFEGPAVVTEATATTYVAPGWRCRADRLGNLLLSR